MFRHADVVCLCLVCILWQYIFAIGLPITHKDVMNPTLGEGKNHLGKLLMEVRQELSH